MDPNRLPPLPPSSGEHVSLFRAIAREHVELMELYPAPTSVTIGGSAPLERVYYWNRVIRASSMRKFAMQASDNMYLETVLNALDKTTAPLPSELADVIPAFAEAFEKRRTESAFQYVHNGGPQTSVPEMIEDLVYGVLFHGDYGRHKRVEQRQRFSSNDSALMAWLVQLEDLLVMVLDFTDHLVERGLLADT